MVDDDLWAYSILYILGIVTIHELPWTWNSEKKQKHGMTSGFEKLEKSIFLLQ